jgi:lysophospholipase L1-like esterase
MFHSWFFGIMLPVGAVTWKISGGSIVMTASAALSVPMVAIVQGSLGILRYRLYFGDAPLPLSPSHGVVIVECPSAKSLATTGRGASDSFEQPVPLQKTKSFPLSLGCLCGMDHSQSRYCEMAVTSLHGRASSDDQKLRNGSHGPLTDIPSLGAFEHDTRRPIRLLLIGDSLAIGVGQARQCTPVMPEVLAKTLSARLGGRVVYWTCHGAPGASTGWIVRELERGVTYLNPKEESNDDLAARIDDDEEESDESSSQDASLLSEHPPLDQENNAQICSDTDESSSDESTGALPRPSRSPLSPETVTMVKQQRALWRERLAQHRKCFDPEVLGPYDIVIVMTGSNDLKSAFFPFLLTGEDAEFRRQAKARGGNYTKELRRLLETLNRDVRSQLLQIRHSVEAATETVIEKVEETVERIVSSTSPAGRRINPCRFSFRERLGVRKEPVSPRRHSDPMSNGSAQPESSLAEGDTAASSTAILQKQFPLVVLPGLPSRALPIFRIAPLRWLAVPIVDILDMHKRRLAKSHPSEVMFVPPPSVDDLAAYESCTGEMWHQRCQEDTILALRDVRRRDCRRVERDLRSYYAHKDRRQWAGEGLRKKPADGWWSWFSNPSPTPGAGIFSVDQIHPNDDGYDFWGRYIANSIADEWLAHPSRFPTEC